MHAVELIYTALFNHFGPQNWWPADSPFEVMVGAVLTQNTNWANVSRAINTLKKENILSPTLLQEIPLEVLAEKIQPSGYYNLKAKRLKNLLALIRKECECADNLDSFFLRTETSFAKSCSQSRGLAPKPLIRFYFMPLKNRHLWLMPILIGFYRGMD